MSISRVASYGVGSAGEERGELNDTFAVFAFVIDSDADKNKSGNVTANPTLAIETSPGNYQLWYSLTAALMSSRPRLLGRPSAGIAARTRTRASSRNAIALQERRIIPTRPSVSAGALPSRQPGSSSTPVNCGARRSC